MKIPTKRRLLPLLLALVMILSLAPTALMNENTPPDTSGDQDSGENNPDPLPPGTITDLKLNCDAWDVGETDYALTLEPNSSANQGVRIEVNWEPNDDTTENLRVVWRSDDPDVAGVTEQENGHVAYIYGKTPGETTVTVSAGGITHEILVVVSGIKLLTTEITMLENETKQIRKDVDYVLFGNADSAEAKLTATVVNNKPNIYILTDDTTVMVEGRQAGDATVALSIASAGYTYPAEIHVIVTANVSVIPWTEGVNPSNPLKFSTLERLIAEECRKTVDEELLSIVGLSVPTAQGTIYQGYKSQDDTGAGAGSSITYYVSTAARGPYIKDLTFVPNAAFTGEKATITFTGNAANNRTFKGRIEVTIEDMHTDVILTARNGEPLDLSAENFAKVCQEQTGSPLSYVIFTLPPASQGVLYRDYNNEMDYGSRVTASERYDRKGLDDITFVPAAGFVGQVTVGYAGYSTTGVRYNGQLVINVTRPLDESIQYQDYGSGEVAFNGGDFDSYCLSMTGQPMRTTGRVSFVPPPASQGALYYRPRTGRGVPVTAEDEYSLTQLSYLVFEAAEGFDGVVRIPFTGTDRDGVPFSGTVELHIQSGAAQNGDIRYTCQPGQSVKLQLNDFVNLCQSMTAGRLYYVTFQSLPDYTQGALFYNRTSSGSIGTRVTTATKYFNSAAPYLNNLSFWATQNFRSVEIPFTVASVNGQTFTGLMVISNGEGAGGGQAANVTYTTSGQQPVTFSGANFDAACRQATNSALNYLRFSLPGSGQGILYYDYRTDRAPTALDPSTTLYLSGNTSIDKVTFVPASGASGVCYIPFSATAINGAAFQGTVEITIRAGAAFGSIVRYSTGGTPVFFQISDLTAASGSGQPAAIRLTGLPDASQGRIYYQYVSPTQYSWLGNTTTVYSVTGDPSAANLVFIPRAGYQGVVTVPYLSTNADGTSSTGSIEITVALPEASVSFDDLEGYSPQTLAAIDYLASQSVVNGTAPRRYEPGASIRRGDFCLMLTRAFRFNVGGAGRGFTDVSADAYYAQAVNEMYALGVVNGVGGGRFQPESTISRQDAAVMVCRALEKAGMTVPGGSAQAALAGYRDRNQVDSYAQEALGSLVRAGLFPVSGDQISPRTAITRADMALLLHRAITNFS